MAGGSSNKGGTDGVSAPNSGELLKERMTDGYFSLDSDWNITDFNEYGRETILAVRSEQYAGTELLGQNLWDIVPESRNSPYFRRFREAASESVPVSFEAKFPAQDELFDINVYPDSDGVSVFFTSIMVEKVRAREIEYRSGVLQELCEVFEDRDADFETKVESVLKIGRQTLGTEFGSLSRIDGNSYTFEVVDAPEETIAAGDVVDLSWTNCERVVATEERLMLADVISDAPELADRPGNTDLGLSCYIGAPVEVDSEVYGTLCFYDRQPKERPFSEWEGTLIDIMGMWVSYELDRNRVERRLVSQRESLERLQSVLAHDLRNPLTVAQGNVELVRETGDLEPLDSVETALARMETIIQEVHELAKIGSDSIALDTVDTAEVAHRAWEAVPSADAELRVSATGTIRADTPRFERLLENLLSNAVSHNDEPVAIEVGDLDDGFYVEDTGRGLDETVVDDPFEPGTSTSSSTGLGLSIVKEIAEAHGWSYSITESAVGGARFEFTDVGSS